MKAVVIKHAAACRHTEPKQDEKTVSEVEGWHSGRIKVPRRAGTDTMFDRGTRRRKESQTKTEHIDDGPFRTLTSLLRVCV